MVDRAGTTGSVARAANENDRQSTVARQPRTAIPVGLPVEKRDLFVLIVSMAHLVDIRRHHQPLPGVSTPRSGPDSNSGRTCTEWRFAWPPIDPTHGR